MTSVDRTAYPRLHKRLSDKELSACYKLDHRDWNFIRQNARNDRGYLVLATMLKTHQQLGYYIPLEQVPHQIIAYLSTQLEVSGDCWQIDDEHFKKTLYRYRTSCRKFLGSSTFTDDSREQLISSIRNAAHTMSDPADLINIAIEELSNAKIELPAFSTLDRLVGHVRQEVHEALYQEITATLNPNESQCLDALLQVQTGERITGFARVDAILKCHIPPI